MTSKKKNNVLYFFYYLSEMGAKSRRRKQMPDGEYKSIYEKNYRMDGMPSAGDPDRMHTA